MLVLEHNGQGMGSIDNAVIQQWHLTTAKNQTRDKAALGHAAHCAANKMI